jgi:uncharacterized protein YecE (DUF72 family)
MAEAPPRIGTAGWSVPSIATGIFGHEGSQLQRYSARFSCAEINTSFYRPHRPETYSRWAAGVPEGFRFAVKAPRAITHEARLRDVHSPLKAFFDQVHALGAALGPILVQLPPSLEFDLALAETFLHDFRRLFSGQAVVEPRHRTWFGLTADELLRAYSVGRVAADPARCPAAAIPGGWPGLRYWRLHGSPRMYFTPYGEDRLRSFADRLSPSDWCIFDNTASGAATTDALLLQSIFSHAPASPMQEQQDPANAIMMKEIR